MAEAVGVEVDFIFGWVGGDGDLLGVEGERGGHLAGIEVADVRLLQGRG